MRSPLHLLLLPALLLGTLPVHAATYYVDSARGHDSAAGTSPHTAWQSLDKVNGAHFQPGDTILLRSGSRWTGSLVLSSSGASGAPIRIDRYGRGPLPHIDGQGVENTLALINVQQVEVRHLEITNRGADPAPRRGVLIAARNSGTLHHIVVADLYIHDVNGTNKLKETGGILFDTEGDQRRSRFDDLRIERNIVWKVDRSGIVGKSSEFARTRWFPSLHVVIRDNYVDNVGGDGIVPWVTDGALIEHNIVFHARQRADDYNAGIWPWSTDNSLFQLNEAAFTHGTRDGEGFDSDFNSRNTHFFYNYSHENDGGFMLICSPVRRNTQENYGNTGTLISHNISRGDRSRIFNLSGADQTTVEDNAVYVAPGDDVQILLVSTWYGWSAGALFRGNSFNVAGTGRYGHEQQRNDDGTYRIAPGWGGARDIRFEANRYFGNQIGPPPDPAAVIDPQPHPASRGPQEPSFDPAHPERFPAFLRRHRRWMLRLFTREFGQPPRLTEPHPLADHGGSE